MDANVQVAVATVVGTLITTLGVVAVALINSRRSRDDDSSPQDNDEVLELVQALVRENARKEQTIVRLRAENSRLKAQIRQRPSR